MTKEVTMPKITAEQVHDENLRSANPGVRWQAQMEDYLATVHERLHVIGRLSLTQNGAEAIQAHAAVAQAAATAAVALAVANTGGDLELGLAQLTEAVRAA